MSLKPKIILLCLLLTPAPFALGQTGTRAPQIRVRGRGQSLSLTAGRVRRTLPLKDAILAARLEEVKLLFVSRAGSFTYLVADACGPSKAVPDARMCGAADECALLWMKLDAGWRIKDIKSARYESCWKTSTSADGYKISGRRLQIAYDDFSESKSYKLSYDADRPELGFQIEESALEN
jgi:hypothetical protein